jgi:hypothetical protein
MGLRGGEADEVRRDPVLLLVEVRLGVLDLEVLVEVRLGVLDFGLLDSRLGVLLDLEVLVVRLVMGVSLWGFEGEGG